MSKTIRKTSFCLAFLMAFMMVTAKGDSAKLSTELFVAWIVMGILIYATYGYHKNRLAEKKEIAENE